jgi:hypothetical protein
MSDYRLQPITGKHVIDYRLHPITGKNVIDYNWLQIMITPCLILFLSYNILFFILD